MDNLAASCDTIARTEPEIQTDCRQGGRPSILFNFLLDASQNLAID